MTRILVWDLPTRLLHWLLAGSLLGAFVIANVTDDESGAFSTHMLLGLVAVFLVVTRLVWGLVGTRHARFASFPVKPAELFAYLREALAGAGKRYAGHNPGSAWAALVIYGSAIGLGVTGLAMSNGSEAAEEVHEVLAWTMIAAVVAHLVGIALHTLRHKEVIALSMLDGKKQGAPAEAIGSARPVFGLVVLALTGVWVGHLWSGYDPATGDLKVLGTQLRLGEDEHGELGERGEGGEGWGDDDDD